MKNRSTKINSAKITEAVCNLCKQANVRVQKNIYEALFDSFKKESSPLSKYALWQIIENLKLANSTQRPMCQDTGIVVVFAEVGTEVEISGDSLESAVNKGVDKAYTENYLRKSIIKDPVLDRTNTGTNTPAVIYTDLVPGKTIKLYIAIKGCGSENMSALKMLKPSEGIKGIVDFAAETVLKAGASACPPVMLGIGIGGTMDYAAVLSKKALLKHKRADGKPEGVPGYDFSRFTPEELQKIAELEEIILDRLNDLEIGTGGFKGSVTAFEVNILTYPSHIAALPVAVNINCHASRHGRAEIFEDRIVYFDEDYEFKGIENIEQEGKSISTDEIEKIRELNSGEIVLLNGYIYTARDAAHNKLYEHILNGQTLPFDIKNKIFYYTGPCPPAPGEIIGPAGPTTAGRMDKFTPALMSAGLLGSIGKGDRSDEVVQSIKNNRGVYFVTTGGIAALLAKKVSEAEIIAYPELGTEAIYRFRVKDFPVLVAIDSNGNNIFR